MSQARVEVAVDAGGGLVFPGKVRRMSMRSAVALFRLDTCPLIAVGRRVQLAFTSTCSNVLLPMEATVGEVSDQPPLRTYTFQFKEPLTRVRELVDPAAAEERRRSSRLEFFPEPADVLLVLPAEIVPLVRSLPGCQDFVQGDQVQIAAKIENISHSGVGVLVDQEAEAAFSVTDRVTLVLDLPTCPGLTVAARIRQRKVRDRQFLYGMQFDWDATPDSREKQVEITRCLVHLRRAVASSQQAG